MRLKISAALVCFAVQAVSAQISGLATTDDGSVVYFSTTLRPVGSSAGYTSKILSLAVGGAPKVFGERRLVSDYGDPRTTVLTNPYQLSVPSVSGDGSVVAYTGAKQCAPGAQCMTAWGGGHWERFRGDVVSGSGQQLAAGDGVVSVSRNGRYAVWHSKGEDLGTWQFPGVLTRVDLTTDARVEAVPGFSLNNPYEPMPNTLVASNGTVMALSWTGRDLAIFDGTTVRPLPLSRSVSHPTMDDQARVLYFETDPALTHEIVAYDVASETERTVVTCAEGAHQPSVSRDGSLLLFLSSANFAGRNDQQRMQAFVMRVDGSELRQLTRPEDDVTSAVLSGDGRVAYAATARNQLLRISVVDGTVEEVIAAAAALNVDSMMAAAGAEVELTGSGLTTTGLVAEGSPHPLSLGGLSVSLNGKKLPMAWVSPTRIALQIPWETTEGEASIVLEATAKSTLERNTMTLTAVRQKARFLRGGSCLDPATGWTQSAYPFAFHEDFGSLMNPCSPAWAGERVHFYMTGLGPVEPVVPTGVATPVVPVSIATEFSRTCSLFGGYNGSAEVLSAELVPGTVGLFQVDIRIPEDIGVMNSLNLFCGSGAFGASASLTTRSKP